MEGGESIADIIRAARLRGPFIFTLVALAVGVITTLLIIRRERLLSGESLILLVASGLTLLGLAAIVYQLRAQLLRPLARLQRSVSQVCQGEPGARILHEDLGVLGSLSHDIDSVYEELSDLYEDMDNRVERQTRRLAQKTASLKILYDVAASINHIDTLDGLLLRFLRVLKEMVNARTANVHLLGEGRSMTLVGAIDCKNHTLSGKDLLPIPLCICGKALTPGDIICPHLPGRCVASSEPDMLAREQVKLICVPLNYHEDILGEYHLYLDRQGVSGREDIMELIATIGNHLGVAIAKQRSDEEARRASIIEERNILAHELHDSLAQTLASLRFQVRMLADTLVQSGASKMAGNDLELIKNGLDEANTELRALLSNFRAPTDERGLLPSLQRVIQRFSAETRIQVFLQNSCHTLRLHPSEEVQILRIVQEALVNIRKHAHAHLVRVMLNCHGEQLKLLVEDDGVGFQQQPSGRPGEHIGLSIMQERARRLGGELRIESDVGEGTRVEMYYRLSPTNSSTE